MPLTGLITMREVLRELILDSQRRSRRAWEKAKRHWERENQAWERERLAHERASVAWEKEREAWTQGWARDVAQIEELRTGYAEGCVPAIMDWQDFEHLIRELFERAFAQHGAEVRVTQASRDRGVDAVVFDPDPLRGGKTIIQAKRYTATVDLSAVRDLYGTIQAENANKGILVTTSNFGPDAYQFAKDKPITLLNGANLLHLLAEHGYQARIDLKEARELLHERGDSTPPNGDRPAP